MKKQFRRGFRLLLLSVWIVTFMSCEKDPCEECYETTYTYSDGSVETVQTCYEIDCGLIYY